MLVGDKKKFEKDKKGLEIDRKKLKVDKKLDETLMHTLNAKLLHFVMNGKNWREGIVIWKLSDYSSKRSRETDIIERMKPILPNKSKR